MTRPIEDVQRVVANLRANHIGVNANRHDLYLRLRCSAYRRAELVKQAVSALKIAGWIEDETTGAFAPGPKADVPLTNSQAVSTVVLDLMGKHAKSRGVLCSELPEHLRDLQR